MPAIGNYNPFGLQYKDYSGEVKTIRLYGDALTALTLPDFLSDFGTLQAAFDAVTLGNRSKNFWGEESIISNDNAATKDAQIETEMLVRCQSATTQLPWSFRIPTVDYTAFNYATAPAGDQVIIAGAGASAATTALVTALQTLCYMPDGSELIEVVGMEVVR